MATLILLVDVEGSHSQGLDRQEDCVWPIQPPVSAEHLAAAKTSGGHGDPARRARGYGRSPSFEKQRQPGLWKASPKAMGIRMSH